MLLINELTVKEVNISLSETTFVLQDEGKDRQWITKINKILTWYNGTKNKPVEQNWRKAIQI